ncbi:MAG: biotin synthase BioB [Deltaproteobacteria bacterium]|nr:biotin synthase BioB [Deltaproteobacteria bacterium]
MTLQPVPPAKTPARPASSNPVPFSAPPAEGPVRHDWTLEEAARIYHQPLLDLVYQAASVHRAHHDAHSIQMCTLLSVKTGKCSEDCSYCSQSAHHHTDITPESFKNVEQVLETARQAKEAGSTRFCMAVAWRGVREGEEFESLLAMVRGVRQLGLEACASLGLVNQAQAKRLADAGLSAYNHNLDTGPEYYPKVVATRTFQDRLDTLEHVMNAGIGVCSGGIIGLGESPEDRVGMLHTLATLTPHPESVPVNALVAVKGTPLEHRPPVDPMELVRMVAAARILMPRSMVRLSAGRLGLTHEAQALAFLAGANSIFTGDKLLTTPNPHQTDDAALFNSLGLRGRPSFEALKANHAAGKTAEGSG